MFISSSISMEPNFLRFFYIEKKFLENLNYDAPDHNFTIFDDNFYLFNLNEAFSFFNSLSEANIPNFLEYLINSNSFLEKKLDYNLNFTNQEEFNNYFFNLPITELLSIINPSDWPYLYRFHCPYNDCTYNISNLEDLKNHLLIDHLEFNNDNIDNYINDNKFNIDLDFCSILIKLFNINISNYHLAIINNDNEEIITPNQLSCCFHQCNNYNFNNKEELFYHKHDNHIKDTNLFILNDFWLIIINYIKKFKSIPKLIDIIKPGILGILNYNDINYFIINNNEFIFIENQIDELINDNDINLFKLDQIIFEPKIILSNNSILYNSLINNNIFLNFNFHTFDINPYIVNDIDNIDYLNYNEIFNNLNQIDNNIELNNNDNNIDSDDYDSYVLVNNINNNNNYNDYDNIKLLENDIINKLSNINNKEILSQYIRSWNNINLNININKDNLDYNTSIIINLKLLNSTLPYPIHGCPINNCLEHFNDERKLRIHLQKHHNKKFLDQTLLMYLEPIIGEGTMMCLNNNNEILNKDLNYNKLIYICPYCNYIGNRKKLSTHINKIHNDTKDIYNQFGLFWSYHINYIKQFNKLPTINDIIKEREVIICNHNNNCNTPLTSIKSLLNHIKIHNIKRKKSDTELPNHIKGIIKFIKYKDFINDEDINNNNDNNEENNNNYNNDILNEIDNININNISIEDNLDLINNAKKWINDYSLEEEDEKLSIPKLTPYRRKLIKKGLKHMFQNVWIPLIIKYCPYNNTNDELLKFDGVIYKINHDIRIHCLNALKINYINKNNNVTNLSPKQLLKLEEKQKKLKEEKRIICLKSDSQKIIKYIMKYIEINNLIKENDINNNQTNRNKINQLENKLLLLLNNLDNNFKDNIFNGNTIEDIRNTLNQSNDYIDNKINWIKSQLDNIDNNDNNNDNTYKNKIRSIYEDCPKKCLDYYIWPKETPNSNLNANDILKHYGNTWSLEETNYINYDNDKNNDFFTNIPKVINEDLNQELYNLIINKNNLLNIIKSRNHLSAHGKDSISNSIFKFYPTISIIFLQLIFKIILKFNYIPLSWKTTKTIMIYKKDNPNLPNNWRPIGITSTLYRLFTCSISNSLLQLNKKVKLFHDNQKGFIGGLGITENISILNELIYDSKRNNKDLFYLTIDFTNAFGTVPHNLIFDILYLKGFNNSFINLIQSIYYNNNTIININNTKSDPIPWKRGVIQGDPLSPLLFNFCLEPLLWNLHNNNINDGINIYSNNNNKEKIINYKFQAYADDLVLISDSIDKLNNQINTLENFLKFSKLNINYNKCLLMNNYNLNNNLNFKINNNNIKIIDISEIMNYLGAPISGNKNKRCTYNKELIEELKLKIKLLFQSKLNFIQKLHALKTFLLPKLDYLLENGQFKIIDLNNLDMFIRGTIDNILKIHNIPISYFYTSTSVGGLGLNYLSELQNIRQLSKFGKLLTSNNKTTKFIIKNLSLNEINYRKIKLKDINDNNNINEFTFLNFDINNDDNSFIQDNNNIGTNCSIIQAFYAAQKLKISFNLIKNNNNKKILLIKDIKDNENNLNNEIIQCDKPIKLFHNIKKILKLRWYNKLINLPIHGHTFKTTNENINSNKIMDTINRKINNKLIVFTIKARTNSLLTPQLITLQKNRVENTQCNYCGLIDNNSGTLFHNLNNCKSKLNLYKDRHNLIVNQLIKNLKNNYNNLIINESTSIKYNNYNLSEENNRFLPDLWFITKDNNNNDILKIIEITIPYGYINKNGNNSLYEKYNLKKQKYSNLVNECNNLFNIQTDLYIISISSLGAIPKCTHEDLLKLFNKKIINKIEQKLSYLAIQGSSIIFWGKDNNNDNNDDINGINEENNINL